MNHIQYFESFGDKTQDIVLLFEDLRDICESSSVRGFRFSIKVIRKWCAAENYDYDYYQNNNNVEILSHPVYELLVAVFEEDIPDSPPSGRMDNAVNLMNHESIILNKVKEISNRIESLGGKILTFEYREDVNYLCSCKWIYGDPISTPTKEELLEFFRFYSRGRLMPDEPKAKLSIDGNLKDLSSIAFFNVYWNSDCSQSGKAFNPNLLKSIDIEYPLVSCNILGDSYFISSIKNNVAILEIASEVIR